MLKIVKTAVAAALAGGAVSAMAVPADLTTLTTAVDFTSVTTAILAIAVVLMGVYVARAGVKFVIAMVKSS